MKVLIIGGVAAGTKAAAKLKRMDRSLDVTIVTMGKEISYAGCGLPYYVGNVIEDKSELIVNTPASFAALTGAKVLTEREVVRLNVEEKKAEDISVIDISGVSVLADFFLIASGNNRNQVQALADNVEEKLGRAGVSPRQVEGYNTANWVLMDYGDIIVHVFDRENRLFYDLERIWRDGRRIDPSEL